MKKLLIVLLVGALFVPSCTHNQTVLDAEGNVRQITSPANTSRIGPDGTQQATQHGLGASLLTQDLEGNWVNMPGPVGMLTYDPKTGMLLIVSPKDVTMGGVEYTPEPAAGQPAFKVASLSFNLSEPLKQHIPALIEAMKALEGMTKVEAEARVKQMQIAGDITAAIVELLLKYFIPTLPD